ncbi:hypothetical protein CC1G_11832 [Coprinopsis cinerea okayama7|uniref:Uncharacterized protein n=1 Tax=Coprinopsis cinerea (strain Okayama-7 / 130 / ATCC MYA-4618 / FGSC 9003) TaxID=240176 RepID=A8N5T4_COPC7|nr:hypothetical protein CC1G_11832 [Coprinopsis cinerea okayama7\|eukprot:XP_001830229.2 hypothetical protein CC1G_11832 [Coprinopsis cinerea okayama7\
MKAVLLLRPNVSLYSTDAHPANCSPYSLDTSDDESNSERRRRRTSNPTRTCECLTQTLCCHGCGNSVGYMIVVPCTRCTSSVTTSNRSTNGHRFVFHSSEIVAIERRYIPGEKGVSGYETPDVPLRSFPPLRTFEHASPAFYSPSQEPPYNLPPLHQHPNPAYHRRHPHLRDHFSARSHPPPSSDDGPYDQDHTSTSHPEAPVPPEHKEHPAARRLKAGECVFWHHLTRGGEILGVYDDERARRPWSPDSPDSETRWLEMQFDR